MYGQFGMRATLRRLIVPPASYTLWDDAAAAKAGDAGRASETKTTAPSDSPRPMVNGKSDLFDQERVWKNEPTNQNQSQEHLQSGDANRKWLSRDAQNGGFHSDRLSAIVPFAPNGWKRPVGTQSHAQTLLLKARTILVIHPNSQKLNDNVTGHTSIDETRSLTSNSPKSPFSGSVRWLTYQNHMKTSPSPSDSHNKTTCFVTMIDRRTKVAWDLKWIGQEQSRARERSANFFSIDLPHIVISESSKFTISLHREKGR
jgi:hypothetical protein